ncbi:MAG: DnaJ domain-containing protein [Hyphomicrobiaceae bacterium]|nr:DnaJ domain-containing protein [Hyphomicrobiaceae bacterium]
MPFLLLGLFVLIGLIFLGRGYVNMPPARAMRQGQKVGGGLLMGLAGVLLVTGRAALAAPLAAFAGMLLKRGFKGEAADASTGRSSSVRSVFLAMTLDHDSGDVDGTVLKGRFAGRSLSGLGRSDLMAFRQEVLDEGDSLRLLESYLDRRFSGWREDADFGGKTRHGGAAQPGAMTEQEAYEVLGLSPGAGEAEIRAAHRRLMAQVHPDRGGSTWLAARINLAKDVLLNRHR